MALHTETRATTDEDGRGIGSSPRLSGSAAIAPSRVRERETGEEVMRRGVIFVSPVCLSSLLFFSKKMLNSQTGGTKKSISVAGLSLQRGE